MITGVCLYCGKTFRRNRGTARDAGKYCSRECAFNAIKQKAEERKQAEKEEKAKRYKAICRECGKEFIAYSCKNVFCSQKCAYEHNKEMIRERNAKERPFRFVSRKIKCGWCGKEFETRYKKSKVFCSEECKQASLKQHEKEHNRRLRGKIVDKGISIDKLIKRDNGICKLCGKPIDKNDYYFVDGFFACGKSYPTIDHVVPLAIGGLHSWDNVQLAHQYCNSMKGDSLLVVEGYSPF